MTHRLNLLTTVFRLQLLVSFLMVASTVNAKNGNATYEVATWPDFKATAVSYTFDDGCEGQFSKAIPMFDEFGYKLTLFTVIDWSKDNWAKLKSASDNGHEVASHTISHPNVGSLSVEKQDVELTRSRTDIDAKITNTRCLTFAYPYCATGDFDLVRKNYISARGCQGFIEDATPKDFMNVSSIIIGSESPNKTAEQLNELLKTAIEKQGWLVYLFHGVDNDGGYSPIASPELRKNLEHVRQLDSSVWVATFLNATKYIQQRDAAVVTETKFAKKRIDLEVTDKLDNSIYNQELTLRRTLPAGWQNARVTQKGKQVSSKIVELNGQKAIQFQVLPDGGKIQIKKI